VTECADSILIFAVPAPGSECWENRSRLTPGEVPIDTLNPAALPRGGYGRALAGADSLELNQLSYLPAAFLQGRGMVEI